MRLLLGAGEGYEPFGDDLDESTVAITWINQTSEHHAIPEATMAPYLGNGGLLSGWEHKH